MIDIESMERLVSMEHKPAICLDRFIYIRACLAIFGQISHILCAICDRAMRDHG